MVGLWEGVPASPCSGASDEGPSRLVAARSSLRSRVGKRSRFSSRTVRAASPDSSVAEFVGASDGKDAKLVAKLNSSAATITETDERRKQLLHQLRIIDRRKALLQRLASGNGSTSASSSRETIPVIEAATPEPFDGDTVEPKEIKLRSKPKLSLDVSMARNFESRRTDVERFCSSPAPTAATVYGAPIPSSSPRVSTSSISYADLPTRRSSRRVTRPRTPSVLLDGMPGETVLRKLPVGVLKCKRYCFCKKVISILYKNTSATAFSAPVKDLWKPEFIPRYFDVITRPMDLGTIKKNMEGVAYLNMEENNPLLMFKPDLFADDVRQVFRNAMIYNKHGDVLYNCASDLLQEFEQMWHKLPAVPSRDENRRKRQAAALRPVGANKRGRVGEFPGSPAFRSDGRGSGNGKKGLKASLQHNLKVTKFDESLSPRQMRKRLEYLRKCQLALRARTVLPKGATFHDRGALLQDVPLGDVEKNEIAKGIKRLPAAKLSIFLGIVGDLTNSTGDEEEEVELDIQSLDTKTLRTIEAFLESTLSNFKTLRNSSTGEEFACVEEFETEMKLIEKRLADNTKQPRRKAPQSADPEPSSFTPAGKDSEELYASSDSDSGDSDSDTDGDSDGDGDSEDSD